MFFLICCTLQITIINYNNQIIIIEILSYGVIIIHYGINENYYYFFKYILYLYILEGESTSSQNLQISKIYNHITGSTTE